MYHQLRNLYLIYHMSKYSALLIEERNEEKHLRYGQIKKDIKTRTYFAETFNATLSIKLNQNTMIEINPLPLKLFLLTILVFLFNQLFSIKCILFYISFICV